MSAADPRQLGVLARPTDDVLDDIVAGVGALLEQTSAWGRCAPSEGALLGAQAMLSGLNRLFGELRVAARVRAHEEARRAA
jgi:hypothetical protein